MPDILPATPTRNKRDVFNMVILWPLEQITKSLRMGDAFDLELLRPLAQRCRALADAYEARMSDIEDGQLPKS